MKRKLSLTLAAVAVCISATSAQGQLLGPPTQRDVEQGAEVAKLVEQQIGLYPCPTPRLTCAKWAGDWWPR